MEVLQRIAPVEPTIRRKSLGLAKQLVRAAESIALNLGEGRGRRFWGVGRPRAWRSFRSLARRIRRCLGVMISADPPRRVGRPDGIRHL